MGLFTLDKRVKAFLHVLFHAFFGQHVILLVKRLIFVFEQIFVILNIDDQL